MNKIVLELEFERETTINVYYLWLEGYLYAYSKILGINPKLAEKTIGLFSEGKFKVYTPKDNLDLMKQKIRKKDAEYLKKVIKEYLEDYYNLKKSSSILDNIFMKKLVGEFVITFLIGDMGDLSLQKEALQAREKTESLFLDIAEKIKEKKYSKDELKLSVVERNKIIPIKDQEDFRHYLEEKNIEIIGFKTNKIFTKEHSREYSLFRVHTLGNIMGEILPKMIGEGAAEACTVYHGGDLVSIYYESEYIKKLFSKVAQKCQNAEYIEKEIENFLKIFDKLKPYFVGEKKPKNTEELKKILDLYAKLWAYIAIVWIIPTLPVDDKIKKLAFKARETTQEYNEAMEPIIKEFLEKDYPFLKAKTRFVLPEEVWSGEVKNKDIKKKIAERERGFIFYKGKLYSNNLDETLDMLGIVLEDKKSAISGEAEQKEGEIKGQIAFKGKVKGKVKILSSVKDLPKVEEGDILVAAMTMPKYLPAMKKASAFVTDEGGITCHAAIMARELKKPCIIGTRVATSLLKDGDLVEVDANKGIVRILKDEK